MWDRFNLQQNPRKLCSSSVVVHPTIVLHGLPIKDFGTSQVNSVGMAARAVGHDMCDLSPITATRSRIVNTGLGSNTGGRLRHVSDFRPKRSFRSFVN